MSHDCNACSSRRDLLKMGAAGLTWGMFGLSLPSVLFMREAYGVTPVNPLYDAAIQIFYNGGPSQTDTWDPKPGSPNEVFNTINTGAKDIYGNPMMVAEHFPNLVNLVQNDKNVGLGLIRSMTHGNEDHDTAETYMNCFWVQPFAGMYPATAAVMSYYFQGQGLGIPAVQIAGANGTGANTAKGANIPTALNVDANGNQQGNPTVEALTLPVGSDANRYARRRRLMEAVNANFLSTRPDDRVKAYDKAWKDAYDITVKGQAAAAFDLTGKPILPGGTNADPDTLKRFTLAQELIKAGIPYVALGVDNNDTHDNNRAQVSMNWGDITDVALSAMIKNLEATGKRILILMGGEFGRTPDTTNGGRDGRDHHGDGFSWAMVSINQPKFKTTAVGDTGTDGMNTVASANLKDPVYPKDVGRLLYKSLGFDVGNSVTFDVPTQVRNAPPVDRVNNGDALMKNFGLA